MKNDHTTTVYSALISQHTHLIFQLQLCQKQLPLAWLLTAGFTETFKQAAEGNSVRFEPCEQGLTWAAAQLGPPNLGEGKRRSSRKLMTTFGAQLEGGAWWAQEELSLWWWSTSLFIPTPRAVPQLCSYFSHWTQKLFLTWTGSLSSHHSAQHGASAACGNARGGKVGRQQLCWSSFLHTNLQTSQLNRYASNNTPRHKMGLLCFTVGLVGLCFSPFLP